MIVESITKLFMKDIVYLFVIAIIFYMIIFQLSHNLNSDNESNMFIFFVSLLGFGIAKACETKNKKDNKNPICSGFYLGSIALLITSFCGWSDMDNGYKIFMLFAVFFLIIWFYNKNKKTKNKTKTKDKKKYIE